MIKVQRTHKKLLSSPAPVCKERTEQKPSWLIHVSGVDAITDVRKILIKLNLWLIPPKGATPINFFFFIVTTAQCGPSPP